VNEPDDGKRMTGTTLGLAGSANDHETPGKVPGHFHFENPGLAAWDHPLLRDNPYGAVPLTTPARAGTVVRLGGILLGPRRDVAQVRW
jgi:hypothetical protein